jgi:hypothetical protein
MTKLATDRRWFSRRAYFCGSFSSDDWQQASESRWEELSAAISSADRHPYSQWVSSRVKVSKHPRSGLSITARIHGLGSPSSGYPASL